jgi:TRAP transporter TAXI family solute receptor
MVIMRTISTVLLALLVCAGPAMADQNPSPKTLTISTGSPGGPYYVYGQGLAGLLTKYDAIDAVAQPTQGPAQNILLLEKREAMVGFVTMGVALQGWYGNGDWTKGTNYRQMRAIFPMYDTAFQFVVPKRLGLKSLGDLAGKRIGVGPRAGTGGIYMQAVFKTLGINAQVRTGAYEDHAAQVLSGELDCIAAATGVPFPAIDLLDKEPLEFLSLTSDQIALLRSQMPELTPSVVPAGSYRFSTEDYRTVGLYNFAVAHKDLADDFVYQLVKTVFEHRLELEKAHSSAAQTLPSNVDRNTFLPFHRGAVRYYREIGITIPPELVPNY